MRARGPQVPTAPTPQQSGIPRVPQAVQRQRRHSPLVYIAKTALAELQAAISAPANAGTGSYAPGAEWTPYNCHGFEWSTFTRARYSGVSFGCNFPAMIGFTPQRDQEMNAPLGPPGTSRRVFLYAENPQYYNPNAQPRYLDNVGFLYRPDVVSKTDPALVYIPPQIFETDPAQVPGLKRYFFPLYAPAYVPGISPRAKPRSVPREIAITYTPGKTVAVRVTPNPRAVAPGQAGFSRNIVPTKVKETKYAGRTGKVAGVIFAAHSLFEDWGDVVDMLFENSGGLRSVTNQYERAKALFQNGMLANLNVEGFAADLAGWIVEEMVYGRASGVEEKISKHFGWNGLHSFRTTLQGEGSIQAGVSRWVSTLL